MAEFECLEFEEIWKASVLLESQGEASFVASLGSAAAFLWHLSLRRALHGELEVVTLHMQCFFGKWELRIRVHEMRRAMENWRICSSTAAKANLAGTCSATSLLSLLGSSDHAELFWWAKPAEGCPLSFCYLSVRESGGADRLGEVVGLLWQQTDQLAAVDQLCWCFCLLSIIWNMISWHCIFHSACCQETFLQLLSVQKWALGSLETGDHTGQWMRSLGACLHGVFSGTALNGAFLKTCGFSRHPWKNIAFCWPC